MDNLFNTATNEELGDKMNMDELYEVKQKSDLTKLNIFNKLLNRIHIKIKTISRKKTNEQHCWFVMPEVLIGAPNYDQANCLTYIVEKLKDNGFVVKYFHPNLLFISWQHWIPRYVRDEFKKQTGIAVDGLGNKIESKGENKNKISLKENKSNENYKSIKQYKPTGDLIYNINLLKNIEKNTE